MSASSRSRVRFQSRVVRLACLARRFVVAPKVVLGSGVLVAVVAAAAAASVACSSDPQYVEVYEDEEDPGKGASDGGFDSTPSLDSGFGFVSFLPERSFSGFDGTHTYTVPLAVYDSSDDLTVTATDPASCTVVPAKLANPVSPDGVVDTGKYFLVTVKRAGEISLTAKSHGTEAKATIEVANYDVARWNAGKARYETAGANGDPACVTCHVGGQAIDHSPAALATAPDSEIATVIKTGISTAGFPIEIDGKPGHKWAVTDSERDGLVTYLRAIRPRGFD